MLIGATSIGMYSGYLSNPGLGHLGRHVRHRDQRQQPGWPVPPQIDQHRVAVATSAVHYLTGIDCAIELLDVGAEHLAADHRGADSPDDSNQLFAADNGNIYCTGSGADCSGNYASAMELDAPGVRDFLS